MANNSAQTGSHRRRWLIILLVIAGVGAIVALSLRPQPVSVETAVVEQRELMVTVQEQGRTRAREPFTVAAPVGGQLLRTALIEGDRVTRGQVIASIAAAPENQRTEAVLRAALVAAEARAAAAEATLNEAEINLQRAQQEAQRREQLFDASMIGQEERDRYRQAADAAQVRLAASEAGLAAARADMESARSQLIGYGSSGPEGEVAVLAPADGYVYKVFEKSERVVTAGTPLFQISHGEALELVVDLLTQEAVLVSPGDRMLISGWGGTETLEGRVNYIEPEAFTKFSALGVEEQRVNVIGELVGTNPGLGAEYRVEAAIVIWENPNVLTVPTSALFRRDEGWHVFVVEADTAMLRAVQTGQRNVEFAEVLDGLEAGAEVVVFPSDLVEDGVPVE